MEGPQYRDEINRFPYMPQPGRARMNPAELREPRLSRMQRPFSQEPREAFPHFSLRELESNLVDSQRDDPRPVEGKLLPFPATEFRAPPPSRKYNIEAPLPYAGERNVEPEMIRMIPLNIENRRPFSAARRIRFPEPKDSEESEENRLPMITEITKIIPIRIENEGPRINRIPIIPLGQQLENRGPQIKSIEEVDNKVDKMTNKPLPIPINAILDMIFRGIRPLMAGRGQSFPIPIDIKIERIEDKPLDGVTEKSTILEKFHIFEKESQNQGEINRSQESQENPKPSSLMVEDVDKMENNQEKDVKGNKDVMEAKVERVEVFDKEADNTHPIPIPADAQDPQIFKIEEKNFQPDGKDEESWENPSFLPNGQGRGARVFPIPQQIREAEIFSVLDARSGKDMSIEIPMESSFSLETPTKPVSQRTEGRQGRVMEFSHPVEGEVNLFPLPEGRAMKPLAVQTAAGVQPQTFTINDARSVRLYPVSAVNQEAEDTKPSDAATQLSPDSSELRAHRK